LPSVGYLPPDDRILQSNLSGRHSIDDETTIWLIAV
jgi:hypothetical protein